MKRFLSVLLCLSLVLALAACHTEPEPTGTPTTQPSTTPSTAPTTVPTEPTVPQTTAPTEETVPGTPVVYELPMSAIVLTGQTETETDENGAVIFTYTYQNVRLYLKDESISEAVTLDLLNRIDSTRSAAADVLADAGSAVADAAYWYTVHYEPTRIDSGILSLSGQQTSYSGGGHPTTSCVGVTYDLLTGKALTLGDILSEDCTADVIARLVVDALASVCDDYALYSDYSATVEERFSGNFRDDEAWHLSRNGLCFDFSHYELAPYSSGVVTAVIPYSQLSGILGDAWFPVEQVIADGRLSAILEAEADHSLISQYAEVILEPEGERFLLLSDSLIYDVTVEQGHWNIDGNEFIPDSTVFSADCLTPGNAIMIQTYVPDTLPNLRITYTTWNASTVVYLSQSGKDGSALLLPNG